MALPIIEDPLYGLIKVELAQWVMPLKWDDHTNLLVSGMSYSVGGRMGTPGSPTNEVGTFTATFKNIPDIPTVGSMVRVSIVGTAGYAFVGYVQDVQQRIVFDDSISYTTPVTLTTILVNDWVGYLSQFQAVGVGGADVTTGVYETDSNYQWTNRVAALNKTIDSSFATKMILATGSGGAGQFLGDTDFVGTIGQHLDLIAPSSNIVWFSKPVIPTNITTGRTSLVEASTIAGLSSSGKTFTDVAGTAGQLHYTEIDFENSTANVANSIVLQNRARFNVANAEVTQIGGFNEENFLIVNNENVIGVASDREWNEVDSTSITTYGTRQTTIQTNIAMAASTANSFNMVTNPSAEYSDDGYTGDSNNRARRRKPSEDGTPFSAYSGSWAMRARQRVANNASTITFSGGESDGIPVIAGTTYYLTGWAARGATSRTDARFQVQVNWYDENETLISTITSGSTVTLTTTNTWYSNTVNGAAPAGASRATVTVRFTRPGALQHQIGDILWADALLLTKSNTATYFDGDTPWTSSHGYIWTGGLGTSPSYQVANLIDNVALNLLSQYSTTSMRVTRIRWNAQEDLSAVVALGVGKTISLVYDGTTTTYRIVGIDANIDPERYMLDYYLAKV